MGDSAITPPGDCSGNLLLDYGWRAVKIPALLIGHITDIVIDVG